MADQANISTPPFYEGWLHKRGEKNVAWKSRYFVLKDDTLSYFTNPHADKPKGQISLDGAKILPGDEKLRSKFGFMISTPDTSRLYVIRASFEEERREWISVLEEAIEWCAMQASSNRMRVSSVAVNPNTKTASAQDANPYLRYFDMTQRVRLVPSVLPSSSQHLFMQQCGIDDSLTSWRQPNALLGLSSGFGALVNSYSLDKCMLGEISAAAIHPTMPWLAMAGAPTDPGIQLVKYSSSKTRSGSAKPSDASPRVRESYSVAGHGDFGERGSIVGNISFRKNGEKSGSANVTSATPFIGFNDEELSDDPGTFSEIDSDSTFSADENENSEDDISVTTARGMYSKRSKAWNSTRGHRSQRWDVNYQATFDLLSPRDQQVMVNPATNQHKAALRSETSMLGNASLNEARPFGAELLDAHVPVAKAMAWKGNDLLVATTTNRVQLFNVFDENMEGIGKSDASESRKSSFLSGKKSKKNSVSSAAPQHIFSFDLPPTVSLAGDPWQDTTVSSIAPHPTNTNVFAIAAKSTLSLYDLASDSLTAASGIVASSPITSLDWCSHPQAGQNPPSFSTPSSFTFLSGQTHSALLAIGTASGSVKVIDSRVLGVRDAAEGAGVYLASRGTPGGTTGCLTDTFSSNIVTTGNTACGHRGAVRAVRWCPLMPYWLASAGDDGGVRLWDIRYPRAPIVLFGDMFGPVTSLSCSQSHLDFLSTGHASGDVCVWNMRSRPHMLAHRDTSFSSSVAVVDYTRASPSQVAAVDASGQCKLIDMTPQFIDKYTWPAGEGASWDMDVIGASARVGMQLSGEMGCPAISSVCSIFGATATDDKWLAPFVTSENDMDINATFSGSRRAAKSIGAGGAGNDDGGLFSGSLGMPGLGLSSPMNLPNALPTGKMPASGKARGLDPTAGGKLSIAVSPPRSAMNNPNSKENNISEPEIPLHPLLPLVLERFTSKLSSSVSSQGSNAAQSTTSAVAAAYAAMSASDRSRLTALCDLIKHNASGSIHAERLLFRLLYLRDFQGVHKTAVPLARKMLAKGQLLRLTALLHRISHTEIEHNPLYNLPYWSDDVDILPGGRLIRKNKKSGSDAFSRMTVRSDSVSEPTTRPKSSTIDLLDSSAPTVSRDRTMSSAVAERSRNASVSVSASAPSTIAAGATTAVDLFSTGAQDPYLLTKQMSLSSSSEAYQQYVHRANNFHWLLDALCANTPPYTAVLLTVPSKALKSQVQLLRLRLTLHFLVRQHDWPALVDATKNAVSAFAKNLTTTTAGAAAAGVGGGSAVNQSLLNAMGNATDLLAAGKEATDAMTASAAAGAGASSNIDSASDSEAGRPASVSVSVSAAGLSKPGDSPALSGKVGAVDPNSDDASSDNESEWQASEVEEVKEDKTTTKKGSLATISSSAVSMASKLTDGIGSLLKHGGSLLGLGRRSRNQEEVVENPETTVDPLVAQTLSSLNSQVLLSSILAILVHDHVLALKLAIELAWILRTSGNFTHFTPIAYALCAPSTYYFNSEQNNYGISRDQLENKPLPPYTLDSDSDTEDQEPSATALSRSGLQGAALMDGTAGLGLNARGLPLAANLPAGALALSPYGPGSPLDLAAAIGRNSLLGANVSQSGSNPNVNMSLLGPAPAPTITSRIGASIVSTTAGAMSQSGRVQDAGMTSGVTSPSSDDFGLEHDSEIQALVNRLRANNEFLKQRQKKAKSQVPVQVKQRAQASADRDVRSPRLVLDSLELLYEVFDTIKRDPQSAEDLYSQINVAAGLEPNSTRIPRAWIDSQIRNINTLPRWNPYREIVVKPNPAQPNQPFISLAVLHPRHALLAALPRMNGNTAKSVMRIVEANSKGELLPSILHRLYIQALNEKEAFDRALYISSKLIKRYQGLPFAKAISRFVETSICGDVVQWIHDMSRRPASAPWECDKVGSALCIFTNIVCSVEELPVLLSTSGPSLYSRVCQEYLLGLQACLLDNNYVPEGAVASDSSSLKQARQKDALARAQNVLSKLRAIIAGPVPANGKDGKDIMKDHSAQWGAFSVHIQGIVKKLDQFVSNKGVKVTW